MNKIKHFLHTSGTFLQTISLSVPSAIIIGSLIISGSIMLTGNKVGKTTANTKNDVNMFTGKDIDSKDYVEGKTTSDIFLVEYSDPECPYCIQLHPTMKQLRTKYEDKIAFVYRHFPIAQLHPKAFDESRAIACAGVVGGKKGYYEYIDSLYGYKYSKQSTRQSTALSADGKEAIAANVGLDATAFANCMTSGKTASTVSESLNDGTGAGVSGTPSSFLVKRTDNGLELIAAIDGARPMEYFDAAIQEALSK